VPELPDVTVYVEALDAFAEAVRRESHMLKRALAG